MDSLPKSRHPSLSSPEAFGTGCGDVMGSLCLPYVNVPASVNKTLEASTIRSVLDDVRLSALSSTAP